MESILLSSFVGILRESQVIFLKNRNLIASISLLVLLFNSFLALCNFFSIRPSIKDFVMNESLLFLTSPGNSEYANLIISMSADLRTFVAVEWFFILTLSIASLLSLVITILASDNVYGELNLSFKDLLSQAINSWKRTLVTWFYISLFVIGYVFFAIFTFLPLMLTFTAPYHLMPFSFVVLIIVLVFHIYLTVVWNLSLVIAVLEEKSGFEAFGRAAKLVRGMKLEGFLLNVLFGALTFIVYVCWNMAHINSKAYMLLIGLLVLNITCLVNIYALMAFTVFYHRCKQSHGEEIALEGNLEYTKMPNQPLNRAELGFLHA